jgi:hypothetical protein
MLLNCVLASTAACMYLTALFLHLNPTVPITPASTGPLVVMLLLSYGVHLGVLFYVLIVLRLVFGTQVFSPGWLSVRVLAWLCASAAGAGGALMWLNLRGLRLAIDETSAVRLAVAAALLTACAVGFILLGAVRSSTGAHGGRGGALIVSLLLALSVIGPFWARGLARPSLPPVPSREDLPSLTAVSGGERVLLLMLDGASLDVIATAAANGRLPSFGRVLDAGASMHLATLRPTQVEPVWTAVATGRLPARNGVRSATSYRVAPSGPVLEILPDHCFAHVLLQLGFLEEVPHTSASVRVKTLWEILSAAGIASGIVRWPLTYPAQPLHGVLITDVLHEAPLVDEEGTGPSAGDPDASLLSYPARLASSLTPAARPGTDTSVPEEALGPRALEEPFATDRLYGDLFERVWAMAGLRLFAWRYQGLDAAGHAYLREAMPRAFGDVSDEERRRYGHVLEDAYRQVDEEVGRAMARLGSDDLLLVVSAFGMEPLSLSQRALERVLGNRPQSGTHERAPDGFLLAYGPHVRRGRLTRASVLDVTPTVLYYLGLPVARDMDGYPRADIFSRAFTAERPLTFIPSYEP